MLSMLWRRDALAGGAAAFALPLLPPSPLQAQGSGELPFIPFPTSLTYYDHGWIQWLPDHPEFEAIEMQIANRGQGGKPLARLFFSRRAAGKTQVFYFDDRDLAAGWKTGEAYYSPLAWEL